jgi:Putative adhesin
MFLLKTALIVPLPILTVSAYGLKETYTPSSVQKIQISSDYADIQARVQPEDQAVSVHIIDIKDINTCLLSIKKEGGMVLVQSKNKFTNQPCYARIEVNTPKSLALDFKAGSGNINIQGFQTNTDASTGSGNIQLSQLMGTIKCRAGSGNITAHAMQTTDTQLSSGSGNLQIEYTKPDSSGTVKLSSGSGNIFATFPPNKSIFYKASSGMGRINSNINQTPGASFVVSAHTGAGNISLEKNTR